MAIKIKAKQTLMHVGTNAGKYRFVMQADTYSKLSDAKVIQEAALRSGISKGSIMASYTAIGDVLKAWATEGHSVAIPGLGTMRFGVRANTVESVDDVGTGLITARRVIFTPSTDIKDELRNTSISISCYDKNGILVKSINSDDSGKVEDNDNDSTAGGDKTDENKTDGGGTSGGSTSGGGTSGGGTSGGNTSGDDGDTNV